MAVYRTRTRAGRAYREVKRAAGRAETRETAVTRARWAAWRLSGGRGAIVPHPLAPGARSPAEPLVVASCGGVDWTWGARTGTASKASQAAQSVGLHPIGRDWPAYRAGEGLPDVPDDGQAADGDDGDQGVHGEVVERLDSRGRRVGGRATRAPRVPPSPLGEARWVVPLPRSDRDVLHRLSTDPTPPRTLDGPPGPPLARRFWATLGAPVEPETAESDALEGQ